MAITKRPKVAKTAKADPDHDRERQEQVFLAGAPDAPTPGKADSSKMQTVHLRFEPELLPRIDAAMREIGLTSRSAFVRYAVVQALKNHEK